MYQISLPQVPFLLSRFPASDVGSVDFCANSFVIKSACWHGGIAFQLATCRRLVDVAILCASFWLGLNGVSEIAIGFATFSAFMQVWQIAGIR